jgi:hypothetical protein
VKVMHSSDLEKVENASGLFTAPGTTIIQVED